MSGTDIPNWAGEFKDWVGGVSDSLNPNRRGTGSFGFEGAANEQERIAIKEQIKTSKDLDEETRAGLLASYDEMDLGKLQAAYAEALDQKNPTTKERWRRQTATANILDTPGLDRQTGKTFGAYR